MASGKQDVDTHPEGSKEYDEHSQLLHELLSNPQFEAAVRAYTKEDDQYDIPFLGGSNNAGDTVYFDRRFVEAIKAGKVKCEGQTIDPRPFLHIHEAVEGAAIRLLHANYDTDNAEKLPGGHLIATWAERRAVDHAGWDFKQYQAAIEPFIRQDEKEKVVNPPPDLLTTPYKGTPQGKEVEGGYVPAPKEMAHPFPLPDSDIVRQPSAGVGYDANAYKPEDVQRDRTFVAPSRIEGGYVPNPDRKLAHAAVSYGRGHVDGDHCAVCRHYVPDGPHCTLVDDPMQYAGLGWCDRFHRGKPVMAYEGSKEDVRTDKREAAKRGLTQAQWERSAADKRMDRSQGGYVPNPQASVTDKAAAVLHPRMHSLAIAAANHLHKMGHISAPQKAQIGARSKVGLKQGKKPAPMFGSLAPQMDADGDERA